MAESYEDLMEDLASMSESEAAQYAESAGWVSYLMVKQAQTALHRSEEMFDARRRQMEEEFDARQRQLEEMFDARVQNRQVQSLLAFAGAGGQVGDLNEPAKDTLVDLALGKSVEAYPSSRTESVNTIFDNTMDDLVEQVTQRFSETYSEKFTETVASTLMSSIEGKLSEIESRLAGLETKVED